MRDKHPKPEKQRVLVFAGAKGVHKPIYKPIIEWVALFFGKDSQANI